MVDGVVITIDGPAAAGKSTVARRLARQLGYDYLDTGATYRAATYKALDKGVDLTDPQRLAEIAASIELDFQEQEDGLRVLCDENDVTDAIRCPEVTENIYHLADEPEVRKALIDLQRRYAEGRNVVTEGRDQGTEVFPDADVKFFLDAAPDIRAQRRMRDLKRAGCDRSYESILQSIKERDRKDRGRQMGGLRHGEDMVLVDSTHRTVEEVLDLMTRIVDKRVRSANS
ncbi:MAG: (d)CMP kinase [Planctomycetota bacterium]